MIQQQLPFQIVSDSPTSHTTSSPPQQKLQRVTALTQAVQKLALARILKQYGEISEHEQRLRLAALWLDRDTMIKVFQWDPEREGY